MFEVIYYGDGQKTFNTNHVVSVEINHVKVDSSAYLIIETLAGKDVLRYSKDVYGDEYLELCENSYTALTGLDYE